MRFKCRYVRVFNNVVHVFIEDFVKLVTFNGIDHFKITWLWDGSGMSTMPPPSPQAKKKKREKRTD